jgi:probable HAF family extracellular repeat protein
MDLPRFFAAAVLLAVGCAATPSNAKGVSFTFRTYDVPVKGAYQTWLTGINNDGTMVGWYLDRHGDTHGFTVTNGQFKRQDFGPETEIWGINGNGDFVGLYDDPCEEEICAEGFLFHGKTVTKIGPPWFTTPPEDDAPDSEAVGLNDADVVVGGAGDGFGGDIGFILTQGRYKRLKVPGVNHDGAVAVNNAGLVILDWTTRESSHAVLYDGMTYKDIGVPGALDSTGQGINNRGDIVLRFDAGVGQNIHGSLLHAGKYYNFDYPQAKYDTIPFGINDKRTIVGVWGIGQTKIRLHGFIATY